MAQEILCEVSNCKFWGPGNKCKANSIYVVSQKGKKQQVVKKRIVKHSCQEIE